MTMQVEPRQSTGKRKPPFGCVALARAGVAIGLAVGLAACEREAAETKTSPTVVSVETVRWTDYAPVVRLTGEIRAQVESDLSFRVAGRIAERLVNVGDHVAAGQVLARLDPTQQTATVTAAEAAVQAADAVLRQATATMNRQVALLAQGYTTKREYDQAEESFRTAQSALSSAKAQLGTARDQLSDTVLRAGVAGVITARQAETGQVVQVAQTVFSIAQDGARDAVFNVNESLLTQPPSDPGIELTLVNDPSVRATGVVREISPTVDPSNGAVRIKVGVQNPPAAMALGASVIGAARFQPRRRAIVPWSALSSAAGQPAVWTVDPATKAVSLRPITIDGFDTGDVIVSSGLQDHDVVVTGGAQFLRPRQVVAFSSGATL